MSKASDVELFAQLTELLCVAKAKKHLWDFTKYNLESFESTLFHKNYYKILQAFIDGKIKRLIVSVPPQHGKTLAASEMLPANMLGRNPNLRIAIGSYSTTQARKFNRRVQRAINDPKYANIYPDTVLNDSQENRKGTNYIQTADEFEVVGKEGSLKVVGRGGPLTGNPVDIMIMDDMYKDHQEGNSPIIREAVWEWYTSVVKTRLHNNSQELIVFTRWHEDDLIGRISEKANVVDINSLDDLEGLDQHTWAKVNFEAIKESEPTEIDPRQIGEALWPERHSIEKLEQTKQLSIENFNCLYQGNPTSSEGLLYGSFETYSETPKFQQVKNYTDTSDGGGDVFCSVSYGISNGKYYVIDVLYTEKGMEYTEKYLPQRLIENNVKTCDIESNNGGKGFGRVIQQAVQGRCAVRMFHQSQNKESRIFSNSNIVTQSILMPSDWEIRWPQFYNDIKYFKRIFKSNKQDGGPDVLTGIIEKNNRKGVGIVW